MIRPSRSPKERNTQRKAKGWLFMTKEQRDKLTEITSQLSIQHAALEDLVNDLSDVEDLQEEVDNLSDVVDKLNRVLE